MASVKASEFRTRAFAFALVVVGCTATYGSAWAQYWGDNPSGGWGRSGGWGWGNRPSGGWGDRRSGGWGWDNRPSGGWGDRYPSERSYRRSPNRDFFYPFSGDRHVRQAPAADYSKAPPPRKVETPPSRTVLVIGDSMADWLGYGLDEKYADHPEIGVKRKIRAASGLIHYDAKNESDWPQAVKEALSKEKPNAIVVMLGLNDRVPLREKALAQPKRGGEPAQEASKAPGRTSQDKAAPPPYTEAPPQTPQQTEPQRSVPAGQYDFHTDQWAALYAKRIDAMLVALKSKGVPVIWVGMPAVRGTKATSDMSYLDGLYRERAERAGIVYVDIWDGFVDEDCDYAWQELKQHCHGNATGYWLVKGYPPTDISKWTKPFTLSMVGDFAFSTTLANARTTDGPKSNNETRPNRSPVFRGIIGQIGVKSVVAATGKENPQQIGNSMAITRNRNNTEGDKQNSSRKFWQNAGDRRRNRPRGSGRDYVGA